MLPVPVPFAVMYVFAGTPAPVRIFIPTSMELDGVTVPETVKTFPETNPVGSAIFPVKDTWGIVVLPVKVATFEIEVTVRVFPEIKPLNPLSVEAGVAGLKAPAVIASVATVPPEALRT